MKAVILAGGFGTRLRPLSCTRPKLLFPIGNRPILDWTIEKLSKSGINEIILAVNYMADIIIHTYGRSKFGAKLLYSKEERPLGTAGPIRKASSMIGKEDSFIVLNGDIFTDIDYRELIEAHRKNGGVATISLVEVQDPSRYGVVILDENKVTDFIEKPHSSEATSNLVNAGIYVFTPEIFNYIGVGGDQTLSFEKEVFPRLAKEGNLYGKVFKGLWMDIGEPRDYLYTNQLVLKSAFANNWFGRSAKIGANVKVEAPSVIGSRVKVGEDSVIGPVVSVGDSVYIGRGVHIQNSIIFEGATISDFSSVKSAIIGENATIGKWVKIEEGCIVGDHTFINDNVTLTRDVTVCPSKEVSESVLTSKSLL
ncbi:MAG: NDP-sugar synthase [Candidatus Bathyarchaeia archaeon]